MKVESNYIDDMSENTSYERVYKKIVSNLIDDFSFGLSDNKPRANVVCSIMYESIPCAILVFLPEEVSFSEYIKQPKSNIINSFLSKIGIAYYVLCHENACFFVYQNEELSLQNSIDRIKQVSSEINKSLANVKKILVKYLEKQFSIPETDFNKYINRDGSRYEFTSDFYNKVFGKTDNIQTICRYTSLRSFFDILNNKTIRMCALTGMNDSSEGSFAYNYLNGDSYKKNKITEERKNKVLYEALILSFCESKFDELTQWRLYGDNAKGVCCEYELDGTLPDNYIFRRIKYEGVNSSGTLEKVKNICDIITQIKYLHIDKKLLYPFFKDKAYSIENEIRLLYKVDKSSELKWMLTQDHSIINAYNDIPLKKFPLKLKRVVLGPKMPNIETNQNQIKRMLECVASQDKELDYLRYVQVEKSTIDCYR